MTTVPLVPSQQEGRVEILSLTQEELIAVARTRMQRGFGAAKAVYQDAIERGVFEPETHGLGTAAVDAWQRCFSLTLPGVATVVQEAHDDGVETIKAVLRAPDGLEYECVRIPMARGRSTLCLSSQIGCKMGCTFCETAGMGLLRNLSAAEIVGQVVTARSVLGWNVQNLVFMGMGEPLDNIDEVLRALVILHDRRGFHFAQQRMTVCTVGHVDGIRRLKDLGFRRLNLSISVNAADDALRSRLMPWNKKVPLDALADALLAYPQRRTFVVALNYCVLPGINDRPSDITALAAFCSRVGRSVVNVIPYNPGTTPVARAPSEDEVERFVRALYEAGVVVTRRTTRGRSVMAACGQLGNRALKKRRPQNASAESPG